MPNPVPLPLRELYSSNPPEPKYYNDQGLAEIMPGIFLSEDAFIDYLLADGEYVLYRDFRQAAMLLNDREKGQKQLAGYAFNGVINHQQKIARAQGEPKHPWQSHPYDQYVRNLKYRPQLLLATQAVYDTLQSHKTSERPEDRKLKFLTIYELTLGIEDLQEPEPDFIPEVDREGLDHSQI